METTTNTVLGKCWAIVGLYLATKHVLYFLLPGRKKKEMSPLLTVSPTYLELGMRKEEGAEEQ